MGDLGARSAWVTAVAMRLLGPRHLVTAANAAKLPAAAAAQGRTFAKEASVLL